MAWGGLILGARWQFRLEYMGVLDALRLRPSDVFDAGLRLPLGMLAGGLLAAAWCCVFRVRWRETGDALAVAAVTTTAIGRIGCILNACCGGRTCPTWAAAVCTPPRAGLGLGSEPVVPLPYLFSATSIAILGVLVWLLRRDAPAGALLVTACILGPIGKLVLEPLRGDPRPPLLMLGIPFATLGGVSVVLAATALRRRFAPMTTSSLEGDLRSQTACRASSRDRRLNSFSQFFS